MERQKIYQIDVYLDFENKEVSELQISTSGEVSGDWLKFIEKQGGRPLAARIKKALLPYLSKIITDLHSAIPKKGAAK